MAWCCQPHKGNLRVAAHEFGIISGTQNETFTFFFFAISHLPKNRYIACNGTISSNSMYHLHFLELLEQKVHVHPSNTNVSQIHAKSGPHLFNSEFILKSFFFPTTNALVRIEHVYKTKVPCWVINRTEFSFTLTNWLSSKGRRSGTYVSNCL